MIRTIKLPGANDPCVCRSGKKFKKCCRESIQRKESELREILNPARREHYTRVAGEAGMSFDEFKARAIQVVHGMMTRG